MEWVVEVEMESPVKALRIRPSAGKSSKSGVLSNFRPQSSSFSVVVSCELENHGNSSTPLLSVCHPVSVNDLGDVLSRAYFLFRDQEVTLLGAFDLGSQPGKIMQDGRGSLSPEVVHQSVDSLHERALVSEAESSSGVGFLGIGVAPVQPLPGYSYLRPTSDPKTCRNQILLDSQCYSLAGNAVRMGCEDNPVLPSLDEDIALSLDSSPSFSMEPPAAVEDAPIVGSSPSPHAVQRNLVPDDDSACRIASDVERLWKQLLELKDQRCLDLQLPYCTQDARESVPDVSPTGNEAAGQGMSLCDANAYPSCIWGLLPDLEVCVLALPLLVSSSFVSLLLFPGACWCVLMPCTVAVLDILSKIFATDGY
ncbi:hypothetical protein Nepgr_020319 [Nepenthes gracilis]|uniref:Uncharacterized protein n=1 Tax=Nepenthes gracilis TaxID=150966 RepID=A0AAD3XV48_NEPGR|nr:hypothetical protein Nepgr_020319 [Nepenthes gracilis]